MKVLRITRAENGAVMGVGTGRRYTGIEALAGRLGRSYGHVKGVLDGTRASAAILRAVREEAPQLLEGREEVAAVKLGVTVETMRAAIAAADMTDPLYLRLRLEWPGLL